MSPAARRGLLILATGFIALAGMLIIGLMLRDGRKGESIATPAISSVGGPFQLVDQTGRAVTEETFRGKWLLVFFGFTYCPDVCPTTLSDVALALNRLGPLADRVQPVFVSVDTGRDTPEVLAQYTGAFSSRILGLTGTAEQVATAANMYRVFYRRVDQGDTYTMDHSTLLYVMGPDTKFVTRINPQGGPERLAERLRELVSRS
ncbi:MAG: SCO family protein [Rhodospirillales bacterium]|nr:SCO family protein [Rhodospirillales bacterium]